MPLRYRDEEVEMRLSGVKLWKMEGSGDREQGRTRTQRRKGMYSTLAVSEEAQNA